MVGADHNTSPVYQGLRVVRMARVKQAIRFLGGKMEEYRP